MRICQNCFACLHATSAKQVQRLLRLLVQGLSMDEEAERKRPETPGAIAHARNLFEKFASIFGHGNPTGGKIRLPFLTVGHAYSFYVMQPDSRWFESDGKEWFLSFSTFARHVWQSSKWQCMTGKELDKCSSCSALKQHMIHNTRNIVFLRIVHDISHQHLHWHFLQRQLCIQMLDPDPAKVQFDSGDGYDM